MAQAGQDAKFFQRGKIEVCHLPLPDPWLFQDCLLYRSFVQIFRRRRQRTKNSWKGKPFWRKSLLTLQWETIVSGHDFSSWGKLLNTCNRSVAIVHGCRPMSGNPVTRNKEEWVANPFIAPRISDRYSGLSLPYELWAFTARPDTAGYSQFLAGTLRVFAAISLDLSLNPGL